MFATILWGVGLVFVIEGLAYALAPSLMKDLMRRMMGEPEEVLRIAGFFALVLGTVLAVLANGLSG